MRHSLSMGWQGRVAIAVLLLLIFFFASCPVAGRDLTAGSFEQVRSMMLIR